MLYYVFRIRNGVVMAEKKYSKLPIDESKISGWIDLWCETEFGEADYTIEEKTIPKRIQYAIRTGGKEIRLDFIRCNGGLLTIAPNVGTQQELSVKLADSIYDRVKDLTAESKFAHGFSIKIAQDDYQTVIDLLTESSENTILNMETRTDPGAANYILHRIKGPLNDTVVIKYFPNTHRMQLQGKPLALFNEVVSMISDQNVTFDDVVDAQLKYCSVPLNRDDIFEEMQDVLGDDLYKYLTEALKKILSTAFIMSKIEIDLPDNSVIVQQALRAYEGFLKKLLREQGIMIGSEEAIGEAYKRDDITNEFVLRSEYAAMVDDEEKEKALAALYRFYFQYRHPYSHASADDYDTAIIENRRTADELFDELIQKMKSGYAALHQE